MQGKNKKTYLILKRPYSGMKKKILLKAWTLNKRKIWKSLQYKFFQYGRGNVESMKTVAYEKKDIELVHTGLLAIIVHG